MASVSSERASPCPSDERFAAFFSGGLDAASARRIELHVDCCASCYHLVAAYAYVYCGRDLPQQENSAGAEVSRLQRRAGLPPGTIVGRYVITTWVGQGGAGVVYAAHDPELDRRVALKLMRATGSPSEEERLRESLAREAKAMAKLTHPNVVAVYDVGTFEGQVFLAMEFVAGSTLRKWIETEAPTRKQILGAFVEAGRGLSAAHAVGLVHRDFKPENVLLGKDGRAHVSDFGLARPAAAMADESDPRREGLSGVLASTLAGTPAYMAPEQRLGHADARSDQYSYCVALYEALFGQRPGDPLAFPTTARAERRVRRVLSRGLAARADQRYPSMTALLGDLDEQGRGMSSRAAIGAVAVSLVAATSGIAFGARQYSARAAVLACSGAERDMASVWNEERQRAIARAFDATEEPFAADAWKGTKAALDAYAGDWVMARTDACQATRVRREQSEAVLDQRMQCLDRRLLEVRALADVLAHGDGKVVEKAVQGVQGLPPASDCSALRVATKRGVPNAKFNTELASAAALRVAGRHGEAEVHGRAALETARSARREDLEAEGLLELGTLAIERHDFIAAEPLLTESLNAAERVGLDVGVAKSALGLAAALGVIQDKQEGAMQWLAFAKSALLRAGGDGQVSADLAIVETRVVLRSGRYPDALEYARRTVQLVEQSRDAYRLAQALNLLANVQNRMDMREQAGATYARALEIEEQQHGGEHPNISVLLGNIGLLAEADGRLDAAAGYYGRAIAIAEQVHPVFALLPDFLAKLGAVLVKMARYGEARTALTRAVSLIDEGFALSPSRQGTILTLLGDLDRREGHFDEARRTLDRAMALFDGLAPDNPERFPAYLFLGLLERDCQRYQRAVSLLEMAQSVAASTPDAAAQAGLDLARVLWSRASPGDRNRARSLVKVARQYFRDHPDEADNDERDTDSWLAQHAPELGAAN